MSTPIENYTKIPNTILDALCAAVGLTGREIRVIQHIIRHTLGFHRDLLHSTQARIAQATGMRRQDVHSVLKQLEAYKIVVSVCTDKRRVSYRLETNPAKWEIADDRKLHFPRDHVSAGTDKVVSAGTDKFPRAKENKKENLKKPPIVPQKGDGAGFQKFWKEYPRKVGKGAGEKAWNKIRPDEQLTERIIGAVRAQRSSAQWNTDGGRFIPHPTTWLNQRRWEDEPQKASAEHRPAQRPPAKRPELKLTPQKIEENKARLRSLINGIGKTGNGEDPEKHRHGSEQLVRGSGR